MANLTVLRTTISGILGIENIVAQSGGDQSQIDYYVNEAIRQILLDTGCYVTSTTVTPGATADYTLTTSFLKILRMYFTVSSVQYPLIQRSLDEIIDLRRNTDSVGPTRCYKLAGRDLLMWYPTPGASDVLSLYYVPYPTFPLSTGTDDPSTAAYGGIPVEYHRLIELYACWKMAIWSGDITSANGVSFKQNYLEGVGQMRRDFSKRGGDEMAGIPLPSRRRGLAWQPRPDQVGV